MSERERPMRSRPGRAKQALAGAVALGTAVVGSGCAMQPGEDTVALDYWLWDSNQLIPYQQCIDRFEEQNPDITVRVSQYGFDDYWTKLTAGFVAGVGPDVLTNHLSRYPEYVERGLLLDLDDLPATAEIDADEYQEGLADVWVGQDGGQYGIPKDFDGVGLFYNEEMLADAGLSPEDLEGLEWNPEDGGTFEEVIARLTVDADGVRGDEEGFDPDNVEVYGFATNGSGGASGQTEWSWLAGANGWTHTNADVWGDEYNYDDPSLHEALDWLFGLVDKGYLASFEEVGTETTPHQLMGAGRAAMGSGGSWEIRTYKNLAGVETGIAQLPSGPVGHPVTMYNGLADSVTADTDHPEEAAELVAFLGSQECQDIVADAAVVLPARPESTERAIEAFAEQGVDVVPFTDLVEEQHTMFYPVTEHYASIESMVTPVIEQIYVGTRDTEDLIEVNDRVNAFFEE